MKNIKLICATPVFGLTLVLTLSIVPLVAQTRGVIMDNTTGKAVVFNADTDTVTGSVTIGVSGVIGDCTITLDDAFAFVTRFDSKVYDIQLSPPALAAAPNPIPISNSGEDTSLSPNGNQVVVCDGGGSGPVSVVDVASHVQLGALGTGSPDCNSVDVSRTGSVLVTSPTDNTVRRLTIDSFGNLTNTGEVMPAGGQPNNVIAAPGGASGVVINRVAATIKSFTVPGLTPVDTRAIVRHERRGPRRAQCV